MRWISCLRQCANFPFTGQLPEATIRQTTMLKTLLAISLIFLMQAPPIPPPPSAAQPLLPQQLIQQPPGSLLTATAPLPPGTATVEGLVTILGTTEPVAGAAVEMRKTECGKAGGETMMTTSGADGRFTFKQVRAGNWCIGAAKSGGNLSPVEYRMRGYKNRGVAIPIADNQQVQNIQLMMPRTAVISGRVVDADGEPMAHARVQAMEAFYQDGQRRLYTLNVVQTNDRGEFSLFWLPPGEYYVAAIAEDPLRQQVMFSVAPPGIGGHRSDALPPVVTRKNLPDGGVVEEVYKPIYYGGGTEPQRAQKIDARPGSSTVIELSFAGAKSPAFHIRGTVMNGVTGQPAEGTQVRLYPKDWTATAVVPYASADKLGNFDIKGVAPGAYALYASATTRDPNAPNAATVQGLNAATIQQLLAQGVNIGGSLPIGMRLPLEMGNQNMENLALKLLPGGTLAGEFIFEGSLAAELAPQMKSSFRVNLSRDPDMPGAVLGGSSTAALAPNATDNSFRIQSIFPGDFRVMIAPFINAFSWTPAAAGDATGNIYVKSIRYGNDDALLSSTLGS